MKASQSEQRGTLGQTEVKAAFERLGWGPVPVNEHDLGIDLFVQARDERLVEQNCAVTVQVKSGPSQFDRPEKDDDGRITGWWYAEAGTDHFDDWINHPLPHLLVLHDLDTQTSYWVNVTSETVNRTGKGCRILVPANNTIGHDSRDALIGAAASGRPDVPLEGTSWRASAQEHPPGRQLRFALLAPRLVAPHRNRGLNRRIEPEEAIALLAQSRIRDLQLFLEKVDDLPGLEEVASHRDWRWRFVHALRQWLVSGDSLQLEAVAPKAPDLALRTAATVLVAVALCDEERHLEALEILSQLLATEASNLTSTDAAWLLVQRARIRIDLGDREEASADAVHAQAQVLAQRDDVTASVISASCAWLIFAASDWEARELEQMLPAVDTAISWWRAQQRASALESYADRTFEAWAGGSAVRFFASDEARNGLISATLNANLAAEHSAWRGHASLLARHLVMSPLDVSEDVAEGLDLLRRSGDHKSLQAAAERLWKTGPLPPLQAATRLVTARSWRATTAHANLTVWETAGDLLEESAAQDAADVCIEILAAPSKSVLGPLALGFHHPLAALKALATLLSAAGDQAHQAAGQLLAQKGATWHEVDATGVLRVAKAVRAGTLADGMLAGLESQAEAAKLPRVRTALLALAAKGGSTRATGRLAEFANGGDLDAFAAASDLEDFEWEVAAAQIASWSNVVSQRVRDAATGRLSVSARNPAVVLTALNLWFPDESNWQPVIDFLLDSHIPGEWKRDVCLSLASEVDALPDGVRQDLVAGYPILQQTTDMQAVLGPPLGGAATRLGVALGAVRDAALAKAVSSLMSGSEQDRADLADLLRGAASGTQRGLLVVLAHDPSSRVRASAGAALITSVSDSDDLFEATVDYLTQDAGALVPYNLAAAAASVDDDQLRERVSAALSGHPSALVRNKAVGLG